MPITPEGPLIEEVNGIGVIRDDLYPGGTKARFIPQLFAGVEEVVYASPCQGGAQYALAHVARMLNKRVTIFVAERSQPHPRAFEAKALGAKVVQVKHGYLNVVQKRAKDYAQDVGARLAPFGMDLPEALHVIATAARSLNENPDEVWCSAGSGTLCRSLMVAWPHANHYAVAVGRDIPAEALSLADDAGETICATQIRYPRPFEQHAKVIPPFPSDPHYDAKAWEIATARRGAGRVLFWNVLGPAAGTIFH